MSDDEIRAFGGSNNAGWSFDVFLFRGQPCGEIRFFLNLVPKFTIPIGIEEIAMFEAKREDLIIPFLEQAIRAHQPH